MNILMPFFTRFIIPWALILLVVAGANIYWYSEISTFLICQFAGDAGIGEIRDIISSTGLTLFGVISFTSTLLTFAIKMISEKLPYKLFVKLSTNYILFNSAITMFFLAIAIVGLSLFVTKSNMVLFMNISLWMAIVYLIFLVFSFTCVIQMIDPRRQMKKIFSDAEKDLDEWNKHADANKSTEEIENHVKEFFSKYLPKFDIYRDRYFENNPKWTEGTSKAISDVMIFVRQYTKSNDIDIVTEAYNAIINLNKKYIEVKRNTFYPGRSSDVVILETLGQFSLYSKDNDARSNAHVINEYQLKLAELARAYIEIDYSDDQPYKLHANKAIAHLRDNIQALELPEMYIAVRQSMMIIGDLSCELINTCSSINTNSLFNELDRVMNDCFASDHKLMGLIEEGMTQYKKISYRLIVSNSGDNEYIMKRIHNVIVSTSLKLLNEEETASSTVGSHQRHLSPYFSMFGDSMLTDLRNTVYNIITKPQDSDINVLRNIMLWSKDSEQEYRKLIDTSITVRSTFSIEVICWHIIVGGLLFHLSEKNEDRYQELCISIKQNAINFLNSFLSVPGSTDDNIDYSKINYLHENHLIARLIDITIQDFLLGNDKYANALFGMIIDWILKAGNSSTTIDVMMNGLLSCMVIEIVDTLSVTDCIQQKVQEHVTNYQTENAQYYRIIAKHLYILHLATDLNDSVRVFFERDLRFDIDKLRESLLNVAKIFDPNVGSN